MKKIALSDEQEIITDCHDYFININAFAGTGKTTTLLNYALKNPKQKFLYICYNKSIQLHAEKIFPSNVKVKTTHSFAYGYTGCHYRHKLKAFITPQNIMDAFGDNIKKVKNPLVFSNMIIKTLEEFCYSQELTISENHVPLDILGSTIPLNQLDKGINSIIKYSSAIFDRMINVADPMPITHDVYMKLFQLNINNFKINFDTIMLDEAQDANPVLLDVISKTDSKKIFVGDSYQSIYHYRGAFNALKNTEATNFYLTNSFRFGQDVADCSNIILRLSGEQQTLKGRGKTDVTSSRYINKEKGKRVVLFRNNAAIMDKIYKEDNDKIKYFIEGGFESYGFNEIKEIINMQNGKKSEHHLFKNFKDIEQVKEQATILDNKPLLTKIILAEKIRTVSHFNRIQNRIVKEEKYADVFLSNTHKVKGKEFDTIELYPDFCTPINPNFSIKNNDKESEVIYHVIPEFQEEANISYVALTRVKSKLYLPEEWMKWINKLESCMNNGIGDGVKATNEAKLLLPTPTIKNESRRTPKR